MSLIKIITTITKDYNNQYTYSTEIKDSYFGSRIFNNSMVLMSDDGRRVLVRSMRRDEYNGYRILASYPQEIVIYDNVYLD